MMTMTNLRELVASDIDEPYISDFHVTDGRITAIEPAYTVSHITTVDKLKKLPMSTLDGMWLVSRDGNAHRMYHRKDAWFRAKNGEWSRTDEVCSVVVTVRHVDYPDADPNQLLYEQLATFGETNILADDYPINIDLGAFADVFVACEGNEVVAAKVVFGEHPRSE